MNVNIAQFLQTLVAITLDDPANDKNCRVASTTLVNCLKDAHWDELAARSCILCPIARTQHSKATTCEEFEAEGFCDATKVCEEMDCPKACYHEFDNWLNCKLGEIGCPNICQDDFESTVMIA